MRPSNFPGFRTPFYIFLLLLNYPGGQPNYRNYPCMDLQSGSHRLAFLQSAYISPLVHIAFHVRCFPSIMGRKTRQQPATKSSAAASQHKLKYAPTPTVQTRCNVICFDIASRSMTRALLVQKFWIYMIKDRGCTVPHPSKEQTSCFGTFQWHIF